jgi:hypothetical protein
MPNLSDNARRTVEIGAGSSSRQGRQPLCQRSSGFRLSRHSLRQEPVSLFRDFATETRDSPVSESAGTVERAKLRRIPGWRLYRSDCAIADHHVGRQNQFLATRRLEGNKRLPIPLSFLLIWCPLEGRCVLQNIWFHCASRSRRPI